MTWTTVWAARAQDVVTDYPDHALLLVWPSYNESWATETLGMYGSAGGQTCLYVDEGGGGATADDRFHQMLEEEWTRVDAVDIPTYYGIHDRLTIWQKR